MQDIFEGIEVFWKGFGHGGRDDLKRREAKLRKRVSLARRKGELVETDLAKELFSSRRGRRQDDAATMEGLEGWEKKREGSSER